MKFGVCCQPDRFAAVKAAGYDYAEPVLCSIADASEAEFEQIRGTVEASGLRAEAFNCFFSSQRLTGPEVSFDALAEYADRALARASLLGGKVAVLGSGGCRRIPEGFDAAEAVCQFVRVLRICGEAAWRYGMVIALEPLNKKETNLVNTVPVGAELVRAADRPGVRLLADFFHMFREDEDPACLSRSAELLAHVHIARPNADRLVPGLADAEGCRPWALALHAAGYDGRISLEGGMPEFEKNIAEARKVLELFE